MGYSSFFKGSRVGNVAVGLIFSIIAVIVTVSVVNGDDCVCPPTGNQTLELDLESATVDGVSGNPSIGQYQPWRLDLSDKNLSIDGIAVEVTTSYSCDWCSDNNIKVYYDEGSVDGPGSSATMVDLTLGKGKIVKYITGGHGITGVVQRIEKVTVRISDQSVYHLKDSTLDLSSPSKNENTVDNDLLYVGQYRSTIYPINQALDSVIITANTVGQAGFTNYNLKSSLGVIFTTDEDEKEEVYQEFSGVTQTATISLPDKFKGKLIKEITLTHGASGVTFAVRKIDIAKAEVVCENKCSQEELDAQFEAGKQYCIDNPEECGLVAKEEDDDDFEAGKQYCIDNPEECGLIAKDDETLPLPATLSQDLALHIPNIEYIAPYDKMSLWADLEFVGVINGDILWKLSDFGENK
ncbi:MAG: hypothetical protein HQK64_08780 [Desulfamplus sp.]|nr:hypothetical protein [Desulfamplus sp.]